MTITSHRIGIGIRSDCIIRSSRLIASCDAARHSASREPSGRAVPPHTILRAQGLRRIGERSVSAPGLVCRYGAVARRARTSRADRSGGARSGRTRRRTPADEPLPRLAAVVITVVLADKNRSQYENMKKLASWVAALRYEDVPSDVKEMAKMCLLDWACVSVYGARSPQSKVLVDIFREEAGRPEAMILVHGYMVPCGNAAMANAVMAASYELCDSLSPLTFLSPGATVISAAVAVAERERCDGEELLTAIIAGYEVCGRVSTVSKTVALPLGVVAAAGKLLDLNEDELRRAFALASRVAATGNATHDSSVGGSKALTAGMVARDGIFCAIAAKKGFDSALETYDTPDEDAAAKQLGETWAMRDVGFRYFGCEHFLHGYLDAALRLMRDYGVKAEDIEDLKVKIPRNFPLLREACSDAKKMPRNREDARGSLSFCLATVFHDGHLLDPARQLSEERLRDRKILRLASKLRVEVDEKLDAIMERGGVLLSPLDVKVAGRAFAMAAPCKGFKGNILSYEELEQKFLALTHDVITAEDLEDLVHAINVIENIDDVSDVIELLIAEEEEQIEDEEAN